MMKDRCLTIVSFVMIFIPWTILPIRTYEWALMSPVAEIMISCYAVFMILGGAFTVFSYVKEGVRNMLMKVCVVINGMYAVFGVVALLMML